MGGNAVRPKLVLDGAAAAIAYYQDALSAREVARFTVGDAVVFAELDVLGTVVTLKDADQTDRPSEPGPLLDAVVADPDAVANTMLALGARSVFDMSDRPWGGRWGRVQDPFGVQWLLQSPDETDPAAIQRTLDAAPD